MCADHSNLDAPVRSTAHTRARAQPSEPPGTGCDEHKDVEQYSQLGSQHRGQRAADREQNPHRQQASGTFRRVGTLHGWLWPPPTHLGLVCPTPAFCFSARTLAGCKRRCDMASMRQVTSAQGEQLARECALPPLCLLWPYCCCKCATHRPPHGCSRTLTPSNLPTLAQTT